MMIWDVLAAGFDQSVSAVFDHVISPLMFAAGAMGWIEEAYDMTEKMALGAVQVALIYAFVRPLEALVPAERWGDRRGVGTDVVYTLLHRLGVFPLLAFFLLTPLADYGARELRDFGFTPFNLDAVWPGVTDVPWVAFLIYLVVLDFLDYWIHRAQHGSRHWWALHGLHHAQQRMTLWSDNRNHLLDDLARDVVRVVVSLWIGVAPAQFVGLLVVTSALQSLQHANVHWHFGPIGRLLVSPIFHRRHHAIGIGHEGLAHGCNFAVLLPFWDIVFRTADFSKVVVPTGVRDQLPGPDGRSRRYGEGFWSQQWLGIKRLLLARRSV